MILKIFTPCLFLLGLSSGFAAEPSAAPAPVPAAVKMPEKPRILVVFYSRTGHTRKVTEDLALLLGADVEELTDQKARAGMSGYLGAGKDALGEKLTGLGPLKFNPVDYELVVIGTPVWSWNMTPAVRTYLTMQKASLRNVAFFTLSGKTAPDKIVKKMEIVAGRTARAFAGFVDADLKEQNRAAYDAKIRAFADKLR